LRRTAAARGDRARPGDAAAADVARRGDERPRPGAGGGGARGRPRPGPRGHDDGDRDPRDGLRPRHREPGLLPRRRRDPRAGPTGADLQLAGRGAHPAVPGPDHRRGPYVIVEVREATGADWPAMWAFMRGIIRAGETFSWDTDTDEATARRQWMNAPPGRTFVAVAGDGTVLGTAEMGPNHGGPAAHVASAGFMVDPRHSGQGVGRRLGEHVLAQARADGLWRALGFEVLATIPDGFRHPVQGDVGLLIMHRRL